MTVFFDGMKLTLHKSQVHRYRSCSDELAVHSCPLLCLQRRVANVASGLFYCWSLLGNNNMATNLQKFTLYYSSKRFVAWDCWTHTSWQVMQRDSNKLIAVSHVHLYFLKRSMSKSIAMLPQVWKIHYISASVTNVPECQTALCRLLFMQYKITWLVRMHLCRLVGIRLYR